MRNTKRGEIRNYVHALFNTGAAAGLSDGELLDRFASQRDASSDLAFKALVERHGPVVLNVCEGMLRDRHDAEDAFQATFLILARRAASIRKRDSVASWLYGVALRVSLEARSSVARRRGHEYRAVAMDRPDPSDGCPADHDEALHEEVNRLPERCRAPVLLCFFEGLTHDEAAQRLGWPVGTVKSRLARAKERLRSRMDRRGLAPSVKLIPVPISLAASTARLAPGFLTGGRAAVGEVSDSVSILMKGVLRAMFFSRVKTVAMFVGLSLGVLGVDMGVRAGGEPREKSESAQAGEASTVAALERRLEDLERKVNALVNSRREGAPGRADLYVEEREPGPERQTQTQTVRKVRPRLGGVVEKVYVKSGQAVRKGDPLVDLFSTELVAAKNNYQLTALAANRDKQAFASSERLAKAAVISSTELAEARGAQEKSQLEADAARDRLLILGLVQKDIDAIKDETWDKKAIFTVRSPVDCRVTGSLPGLQDLYDPRSVLMYISTGE